MGLGMFRDNLHLFEGVGRLNYICISAQNYELQLISSMSQSNTCGFTLLQMIFE
jgi:hypothetical protein